MPTVLLVDDEPTVLFAARELLRPEHDVVALPSAELALERLDGVDVVVTDLSLPHMDGLQLLGRIRAERPLVPVILLTARGSERAAVAAMKAGAYDYLTKPFAAEELRAVVSRAAELSVLRRGQRLAAAERAAGRRIVGRSPALLRLLELVERLAPRDVNVLVAGETGTGKELVATMLHAQSRRSAGPLVRFNAAAVPETLAEAELFGHGRGAFTGAAADRRGYFAQADGGTLVVDEVGELPLGLQAKLLRATQHGEIQPLGSRGVERVDVRLVTCTHRDLRAEAQAGRFREDLYYRLAVVELRVPPLRERREDIPLLAAEFARDYAAQFGLEDVHLSPELSDVLAARPWPGNIRELENTVARLVALSEGGPIGLAALESGPSPSAPAPARGTFHDQVTAFERELLARALAEAEGNRSRAARILGMSRVTMIDRLKRHGLLGP